jgi:hypothetical protein
VGPTCRLQDIVNVICSPAALPRPHHCTTPTPHQPKPSSPAGGSTLSNVRRARRPSQTLNPRRLVAVVVAARAARCLRPSPSGAAAPPPAAGRSRSVWTRSATSRRRHLPRRPWPAAATPTPTPTRSPSAAASGCAGRRSSSTHRRSLPHAARGLAAAAAGWARAGARGRGAGAGRGTRWVPEGWR